MTAKQVRHSEEIDELAARLMDLADVEAARLRRANATKRVFRSDQNLPDASPLLYEALLEALSEEFVPAGEVPEGDFRPFGFNEELIKKALVGLKIDALKTIARERHLPVGGGLEDLAKTVGRSLHWDGEEAAALVLAHEPEPTEKRSQSDRLYPLDEPPNLGHVRERLRYVVGRYIRTGIARWFVFEGVDEEEDGFTLRGSLRAYQADVLDEEVPIVVPVPTPRRPVQVVLNDSSLVLVRHANTFEGAAAIKALATAAGIRPLGYVEPRLKSLPRDGEHVSFAPQSLFMLDLLSTRLRDGTWRDLNLTVARFRVDERAGVDEDSRRPELRAVRFEGAYVLDSPPACKLLAESRALVEMSFIVTLARADEVGRFPVKVALERDHALVQTGFGLQPAWSREVHRTVLAAVYDEISDGIADSTALVDLTERIKERAQTEIPIEEADMLPGASEG